MANPIETALETLATQAALAVTAQGTQSTAIDALTTQVTALVAAEVAKSLPQGVPAGSTPFTACNQAAATDAATAVVVRASPGPTRMFITEMRVWNSTTAETATGMLNDDTNVVLCYSSVGAFDDDGLVAGIGIHKFNPPIICGAGLDLEWTPFETVGDTWCAVVGYDEP